MAQLDPGRDYLTSISDHGAMSIDGMNPDFRNKLFQLIYSMPPELRSNLRVVSGFRDNITQARLYAQAIARYGSAEAARQWVAPPGGSNHNKGLAADLGWTGGGLGQAPPQVIKYLHDNAGRFGLTFPLANENWHIEPAGLRTGQYQGGGNVRTPGVDTTSDTNEGQGSTIGGPYGDYIREYAAKYNLSPNILYSQMMKESNGNRLAVSPAGAVGLSQLMPDTAKQFGVTDRTDPSQSLQAQAQYMAQLAGRYGGSIPLALAAYNWGPGNVDKINGDLSKAPASVQQYVKDIMNGAPGAQEAGDTGQKPQTGVVGQTAAGIAETAMAPIEGAGIAGTAVLDKARDLLPRLATDAGYQPSKAFTDQDWTKSVLGAAQGVNTAVEQGIQNVTGESAATPPQTFLQSLARNVVGPAAVGGAIGGLPGAVAAGAAQPVVSGITKAVQNVDWNKELDMSQSAQPGIEQPPPQSNLESMLNPANPSATLPAVQDQAAMAALPQNDV